MGLADLMRVRRGSDTGLSGAEDAHESGFPQR